MFGKKPKPADLVKKWRTDCRRESRNLDRSIREIEMQENKIKTTIKARAKAGDTASAKILAKELVQSRKAKERLYTSKAQLHSVELQLTEQASMLRVAGCMAKSTQVMQYMNQLVRLPQLNQTMMAMSREMQKAGLIDEMISDTMSMGEEDLDQAADEEVDKVYAEITADVMGNAGVVPTKALPTKAAADVVEEPTEEEKDLEKRLAQLKG